MTVTQISGHQLTGNQLSGNQRTGTQMAGQAMPVQAMTVQADDLDEDMSWQEQALCSQTDPEAFFPEKGGSTREAKKICVGCEVKAPCLTYALANDERFGIWGGLSERERRRLKRRTA